MAEPLDRRHATNAFLALLERGAKVAVYDEGQVPQDAAFPFVVVRPDAEPPAWAPTLADDYSTPKVTWVVSCAGKRRDQAEALMDRVRRTVVQRKADGTYEVPIDGLPDTWSVAERCSEGYQGCDSAGDSPNVVWTAHERFALSLATA